MIDLKLELEKVNLILVALSKLSYEVSAPLIDEIKSQATPQIEE